MKLEAGQKAKIFCLSDKPEGTIISVGEKNVTIEIERGTLIVDKDDIVEGNESLQVLNYSSIEEKVQKEKPQLKFADDVINTVDALDDKGMKNLYTVFMHFVRNSSMDENGRMFPIPCVFNMSRGGQDGIAMAGLAIPMPESFSAVSGLIKKENPKELILGVLIENMSKGEIDKKYKQVFCIFRMKNAKWMYGVIGVNDKKDLQAEPDWNNPFWTAKMKAFLGSGGAIPIEEKIGTAYSQKIKITKWLELPMGYLYEGDIIVEKLDEVTQAFLKNNNLDPNNKEQVLKYFADNDMKLDFNFMKSLGDSPASVNLMVTNKGLMFLDRRSRTRAVLEAIEAIAKTQS
jgi:hypothetical protein